MGKRRAGLLKKKMMMAQSAQQGLSNSSRKHVTWKTLLQTRKEGSNSQRLKRLRR